MAYQKISYVKQLQEEFAILTKNFDLEDWRAVRTDYYWKSDAFKEDYERWNWKLSLIRHYVAKGVPMS
jgi:hypothetical protein